MSSNNTTASGGVRNLRAMFETKTSGDQLSTSPPSRGRSPADTDASVNSRPVSKVRASFIAVERPSEVGQGQQWGLKKTSDVRNMADMNSSENKRPLEPDQEVSIKDSMTSSPENSSYNRHVSKTSLEGGLGTILKGSAFEPSTPAKKGREDKTESEVNDVGAGGVYSLGVNPDVPQHREDNRGASVVDKMSAMKDSDKLKPPPTTKLITTKTAQPIKPLPTRQGKPHAKSPVLPKSPKTPTTPVSTTRASPKLIHSSSNLAAKSTAARQSKTHESKASQTTQKVEDKNANTIGGTKDSSASPRLNIAPQSPPKAVKRSQPSVIPVAVPLKRLEAAHPATNGTKPRSPVAESKTSTLRRPAPKINAPPTGPTIAKKAPRASLPVQMTSMRDRPKSRISSVNKPADEGFLARMMRPTASTAQKAHDKVLVSSPPRTKTGAPKTKTEGNKSLGTKTEDKENEAQRISPVEKKEIEGPPTHG